MAALAATGKKSLAVDIMLRTLGLEMVADTLASPPGEGTCLLPSCHDRGCLSGCCSGVGRWLPLAAIFDLARTPGGSLCCIS